MKHKLTLLLTLLIITTSYAKENISLIIKSKGVLSHNQTGKLNAIAINNGKIAAIDNFDTLLSRFNPSKIIDVSSGYLYPGFIDAHCHFSGYALDAYKCDLVGTTSFDDVLQKLKTYEKTNKLPWIYARGWDQNDWDQKKYPTKDSLDKLFPNKPVILKRVDGHAVLANQKALTMANITVQTNIKGGIIEKKNSQLTGILIDNATEPVEALIPMLPKDQAIQYLKEMEQECYQNGLTGVVDCGVKKDIIELLNRLYTDEILTLGNSILLSQDSGTIQYYSGKGPIRKGQFQITGIKVYADGALGSRGACLLKDYNDMPGHRGMLLSDMETFRSYIDIALKNHWQVCTHAIGDSANRTILDLYGSYLKEKNDRRWRIEHAQVVNSHDHSKFGKYSIIPSVQPTHAISDMPWVKNRLGESRMKDAYAYKKLLNQNGWIALGTDFPVEAINPIATFYTAVVRRDKNYNPEKGFLIENALSREEALNGMTIWAAKSVFLEKDKGSLEVGKDADIVILDTNLLTCSEDDILETKVLKTIVRGTIKYEK